MARIGPVPGDALIPAEIRAARRRLGLSQAGLAAALGLPEAGGRVTVARWEAGARRPPSMLARALEALDARPARR